MLILFLSDISRSILHGGGRPKVHLSQFGGFRPVELPRRGLLLLGELFRFLLFLGQRVDRLGESVPLPEKTGKDPRPLVFFHGGPFCEGPSKELIGDLFPLGQGRGRETPGASSDGGIPVNGSRSRFFIVWDINRKTPLNHHLVSHSHYGSSTSCSFALEPIIDPIRLDNLRGFNLCTISVQVLLTRFRMVGVINSNTVALQEVGYRGVFRCVVWRGRSAGDQRPRVTDVEEGVIMLWWWKRTLVQVQTRTRRNQVNISVEWVSTARKLWIQQN